MPEYPIKPSATRIQVVFSDNPFMSNYNSDRLFDESRVWWFPENSLNDADCRALAAGTLSVSRLSLLTGKPAPFPSILFTNSLHLLREFDIAVKTRTDRSLPSIWFIYVSWLKEASGQWFDGGVRIEGGSNLNMLEVPQTTWHINQLSRQASVDGIKAPAGTGTHGDAPGGATPPPPLSPVGNRIQIDPSPKSGAENGLPQSVPQVDQLRALERRLTKLERRCEDLEFRSSRTDRSE